MPFFNARLIPGLAVISLTLFPLPTTSLTLLAQPLRSPTNSRLDAVGHTATQGHTDVSRQTNSARQVLRLNATPEPVRNRFVALEPHSAESICPAQLGAAIEQVINRPQFRRARWGILIEPLLSTNQDAPLYRRDAERFFIPASNLKLLTTAAALRQLGSNFRIRTSVYVRETVANQRSLTDADWLRVVGRGDPSLGDAQLRALAQQLKRQGIRSVQQLIVDDGYFQGETVNLHWEWEDVQADYGAAVNSLILNQNAVELTVSPQQLGQPLRVSWSDQSAARQWRVENNSVTAEAATPNSVTVAGVVGQPMLRIKGQLAVDAEPESFGLAIIHPAEYFLAHVRNALAAEGINVVKAFVGSNMATASERELAAVESPPLAVLLVETNQESNNLYAEVLLRSLLVSVKRSDMATSIVEPQNSDQIGLNVVKQTLTELGVNPESYVMVDASGLSRQNLVSPEAIVQTLKLMAQTPQAEIYRASLPVAGISGTLRRRFLNTAAQGHLQAKTGTVTGVSALSGYLDVPSYQPLVFSIMVNQSDQSVITLRQAIDEIVLLLTRLDACRT